MHFRSTRIYQRALDLTRLSRSVMLNLPTGHAYLADQLRRAASSVPLNFAEGCGKSSRADRRRFFTIARGSAYEVAAVLDVGLELGAVERAQHAEGVQLCDQLAAMLTKYE